jgi:lysophospholipase L1-like esterase
MGGNDVLSYSTSGGAFGIDQIGNQDTSTYSPYDITDPTAFNNAITGVVSALTANGAKGVLSNVPYVTDLPFFTTVPFDALAPGLVDQPTIELLNAQLYGLLNGIFTAYGEPNRVNLLSLTDANPVLIQDNDATDFSAQITGYLLTLGFPAETAGAYGAIFGQARQTTENDLILLSASGAIGAPVLGAPEPLNIAGISNPLANQYVLTDIETQKSNNATDAFSQIVQNLATEYGLAFVDLKLVLAEAATTGIMFDEFNLNADFITGGLVSVNGIHLTARGYALMANEFLEQIDATYGSNFGASGSMVKAGNFVVFYPEGL